MVNYEDKITQCVNKFTHKKESIHVATIIKAQFL